MGAKKGVIRVGAAAGGLRAMTADPRLQALIRENERRVKCRHCDLMILPETMQRHLEVVHGE